VQSRATFAALGTTVVVLTAEPQALQPARDAVAQTVDAFDRACSRFREDSELSALNAAGGARVQVSPLFLEAVAVAVRAARITDGDVDPTIGQALIALGYDRDFCELHGRSDGYVSIASVPGWRTIEIDPDRSTVKVVRGVSLDLGATAKALAADHAAAAASAAAGGGGVLVSLGGDISIAGPAPADGWPVRVTDDHRAGLEAPGQSITLRSGGLATSSTTVRRWRAAGAPVHHLIDPGTGRPANVTWRTATVAAASCVDANIATTATIVRGVRAVEWLEGQGLPSRLVSAGGTVRHLAGWPAEGEELALADDLPSLADDLQSPADDLQSPADELPSTAGEAR
jgi:thiamine biosynthesis lipoprotein